MLKVLNNYYSVQNTELLLQWYTDRTAITTNSISAGVTSYLSSVGTYKEDEVPKNLLDSVLNNMFNTDTSIEEFIVVKGTTRAQIHADGGIPSNNPTLAINITLEEYTDNYTVFFDNYWNKGNAKFFRTKSHSSTSSQLTSNITDYSDIINYTNKPFDKLIYDKYLSHLDYENLHGLTVHSIIKNTVGTVMIWDRTMIHCSSNSNTDKMFALITLNKNKIA